MRIKYLFILLVTLTALSACAVINPHYDAPSVGLKSLRMVPGKSGAIPEFEIGLHLINPNSSTLPLRGIFYTISLDGERILSGVTNTISPVKGYGEADITIRATIDLLGGVQLINRFLRGDKPSAEYTFTAKIDTGKFLSPMTIEEKGRLPLFENDRRSKKEEL